MQIISGKKRGTKLIAPKTSTPTRPTSGRAREALFNMLSNPKYGVFAPKPTELIVADIFAGTGALGLEAWSRGASEIVFIENNSDALFALHANISKLGAKENTTVIAQDAARTFSWHTKPAQLVFCDPPWQEDNLASKALNNLIGMNALASEAIIAIEHDYRSTPELPSQLKIIETRHWSKTAYTIATVATNGD